MARLLTFVAGEFGRTLGGLFLWYCGGTFVEDLLAPRGTPVK